MIPSGKPTKNYWTWPIIVDLDVRYKRVIFHSYVSSPEGNGCWTLLKWHPMTHICVQEIDAFQGFPAPEVTESGTNIGEPSPWEETSELGSFRVMEKELPVTDWDGKHTTHKAMVTGGWCRCHWLSESQLGLECLEIWHPQPGLTRKSRQGKWTPPWGWKIGRIHF